jgi:hypothetical protein
MTPLECTGLPHGSLLTAIHARKFGEELDGEERWRTIKECGPKRESGKKLGFPPIRTTSRDTNDPEQNTCSENECCGCVSGVRRMEQ